MNKFKSVVILGAVLALSMPAFASDLYVGATLNKTDIKTDVTFGEYKESFDMDNSKGYGLTVGYDLNSYVAFEYEVASNGSGNTVVGDEMDIPVHWKSRSQTVWVVFDPTLFNIGTMPLKLTVRGGFAYTKINSDLGTMADTGMAIGGGFALGVTKNLDILLDCRSREVDQSYDVYGYNVNFDSRVQSYNIGVKYNF